MESGNNGSELWGVCLLRESFVILILIFFSVLFIRDYLLLTFVALDVVGLIKLVALNDGLVRLILFELFVFVLAADDAGEILLLLF